MVNCQTCLQIKDKKNVLYEDERAAVLIPPSAACKGHIVVAQKKHTNTLDSLDDSDTQHLFFVANYAASTLFQTLGAQGTNMIASTGNIYKDDSTHFLINVVPRRQNDGLNFIVNGHRANEADLNAIAKKIKDKTDFIGVARPKKEVIDLDKWPERISQSQKEEAKKEERKENEKKEEKSDDAAENYFVKQLRRIP